MKRIDKNWKFVRWYNPTTDPWSVIVPLQRGRKKMADRWRLELLSLSPSPLDRHLYTSTIITRRRRRGGQERRKIFNLVLANGRSLPPKEVGSTRVLLVVAANPWRKIANRPAPWPHCSTPPDRLFLPHRLSPEPCLYQDPRSPRRDEKSMLVSNHLPSLLFSRMDQNEIIICEINFGGLPIFTFKSRSRIFEINIHKYRYFRRKRFWKKKRGKNYLFRIFDRSCTLSLSIFVIKFL